MKMNWYQIDRRLEDSTLQGYEMVKAPRAMAALKQYLGEDYDSYTVVNGKWVITATCPEETSEYLEVRKVQQG